jgi:hypothetical protein
MKVNENKEMKEKELMSGGNHLVWSVGNGSLKCTIVYQATMSIS